MYDLINSIIGHAWVTSGANEQQYVYVASCAVIIIVTVYMLDVLRSLVKSFSRH